MPFISEKQRRWMHANEPAMAERWEREELKGKWPKVGVPGIKHTRPAKPAKPARPAKAVVAFATHAAYEKMLDDMYASASTTMYGGPGASPAPRDPIPDFADLYWQPRDNTNVQRNREQNENRRATLSERNKGKFGFHGGADVEPEIRYDQDDYPMSTRRGMEQSPTKRASTQTADLNAYDQPITTEERRLVVKRNTPVVQDRSMLGEKTGVSRKPKQILVAKFSNPHPSTPSNSQRSSKQRQTGSRLADTNASGHNVGARPFPTKNTSAPKLVSREPAPMPPQNHPAQTPQTTASQRAPKSAKPPTYSRMGH